MTALPREYYFNICCGTSVILSVEQLANLLYMLLYHGDRKLAVDLHAELHTTYALCKLS